MKSDCKLSVRGKESATRREMYVAPRYTHRLFCDFKAEKKTTLEMKDILRSLYLV